MTYWISVKSFFSLNATLRWFCHVDDDNYVNVRTLVKLLSQYQHTQDMYIGKPSLDRPIEATERLGDNKMVCQSFFLQISTSLILCCLSAGHVILMKLPVSCLRNPSISGLLPAELASVLAGAWHWRWAHGPGEVTWVFKDYMIVDMILEYNQD